MQKFRVILGIVLVAVVFGLGLFLGVVVPRIVGLSPGLKVYSTATVLKQVQTVSELATVKYVMEKVVVLEDVKWYGENRLLLVAHGVVKAGVDLGKLEEKDVKINGQKISIRLPPPQIIDAFLDEKQTVVIERSTGLLRDFDKDLEQTGRQTAVDDIRRAARLNGILKDAEDRAQWQLKVLFHQLGFQDVEFLSR